MTSDELRTKVAEAIYNIKPVVIGLGDEMQEWTWDEMQKRGYGAEYIRRADAVLPLILDAAKTAVQEASDRKFFSEDDRTKWATRESLSAIDSLRTKP